jgi:hypothetical protein
MKDWWQWINENGVILGWLGVFSVTMFIVTIMIIPLVVARIPAEYFLEKERHVSQTRRFHPVIYMTLVVGKNLIGGILILAGITMLVLPGQGILTILIGISLTNFPGKYNLERKLVSKPNVFKTINWLRQRAGKPPLAHPEVDAR